VPDLPDDCAIGRIEVRLLAFGRRLSRTAQGDDDGQAREYERGQKPQ
jgi:hypothetical protein